MAPAGLPHSEIRGSSGMCPSPRLIAACHVLPASSAKASTVCPYHLLSNSMVRYIHTLAGRVRPRPARSDAIFLKKKISSLSRYAALKVREGETLRTGYRALPGVESSASNSMYLRVPDGTAALVKKSSVSPKR